MQNGSKNGLTIAGGNGQGDELNQFLNHMVFMSMMIKRSM
jgi:hypothetical protein